MDRTEMTDELIMAYADGELGEAEARKVELAAARDPEIQRKLRLFTETATQLKSIAGDLPPVPDALAQRVEQFLGDDNQEPKPAENVVLLKPRTWTQQWPAALAASITLVAGLVAGAALAPFGSPRQDVPIGVAALADPEISTALSQLGSGESMVLTSGATLNMIASFADAENVLCREFDYEAVNGPSVVSVSCLEGDDWRPKIAIATNAGNTGSYAPASSLDALEAWLSSSGLGSPLSEGAEREALKALNSAS